MIMFYVLYLSDNISRVEDSFSEDDDDDRQPERDDGDVPSDDGSEIIPVMFQPRQATNDWVPVHEDDYHLVFPFRPTADPGPTHILPATATPINFFELFLSNRFLCRLVRETNNYAQIMRNRDPDKHKTSWKPIEQIAEMKAFLALTMLIGIVKKPKLKTYWSTNPLMESPIFPHTMPRDRFTQILRYLHFVDPNDNPNEGLQRNDAGYDPLWKIRWVIDHFNTAFQVEYTPSQNISIDEHMTPHKGRLYFKQYLPAKPKKFGIKSFDLAESTTGYVMHQQINTGKSNNVNQVGLSERVVMSLMTNTNLLNKEYHVYFDNWYTSKDLLKRLWNLQTPACGTVRINRVGLPKNIMRKKPYPEGLG